MNSQAPIADSRGVVAELFASLGVARHPVLKLPAAEVVLRMLATAGGREELVAGLQRRQRRIDLAGEDPLEGGFEPQTWGDADGLLMGNSGLLREPEPACEVLAIFGGNRATKTWYAVKRLCQLTFRCAGARVAVLSESETASVTTVQAMVWNYFKGRYAHLNGKRDVVFKINYSQAGGFTDRKLVLPNGTEIYFLTYNLERGYYVGWEFGAPAGEYLRASAAAAAEGRFMPANIGAVADESMPMKWLTMLSRRVKFRKSKLLWTFTPVKGMTPAIKEVVGSSARTLVARPSELLPRRNLAELGEGEMPYVRRCAFGRALAIYFFTEYSPFETSPGRRYYDEIKELCEGKTSEYVERVAYGLARDTVARAFPKFGPWNVVRREQLPAVGTNYFFCDPAGVRPWFMLWCRVTPGNPGSIYIYRDWPDGQTYGEWAVPTEREVNELQTKGWDGDAGPAQGSLGFGVKRYKEVIRGAERVGKGDRRKEIGEGRAEGGGSSLLSPISSLRSSAAMDPYGVRLLSRAGEAEAVYEVIEERFVDPRAGASEHLAEEGGTCIMDEFAEEQRDKDGRVVGAAMELTPASGVGRRAGSDENEGLTLVNELLDWDQDQPLMPVVNQPHLFVCEDCQQVRWMFENFTGRGGEKGACKDPADLVRYMALAKLEYVPEGGRRHRAGKGW